MSMRIQVETRVEVARCAPGARMLAIALVLSVVAAMQPTRVFAQAAAPQPEAGRLAPFEAFVQQQMAIDKTTGLSLAFQMGDTVWAKGFGYADVENKVPATPESSYRLASITKPMTASAI